MTDVPVEGKPANVFADEAPNGGSTPSHGGLPSDSSPYHAPRTESLSNAHRQDAAVRPTRVAPGFAILVCQIPLFATIAAAYAEIFIDPFDRAFTSLAWFVAIESAMFNVRTLFFGPGRIYVRLPILLFVLLAYAALPGWCNVVTGGFWRAFREGAYFAPSLAIFVTGATLPAAAVLWALGSRDRADAATERRKMDAIAFGLAFGLAVCCAAPAAIGYFDFSMLEHEISDTRTQLPNVFSWFVIAGVLLVPTQVWRVGVRGLRRFLSWATAVYVLLIGAPILYVVILSMIKDPPSAPMPGGVNSRINVALAFLVVPIAREVFLRFAGYRAVNYYVERWKARRARRQNASEGRIAKVIAETDVDR